MNEVMTMGWVYYFLGHSVYKNCRFITVRVPRSKVTRIKQLGLFSSRQGLWI